MIWNFETLRGYTLFATDGSIGRIIDLYFEDAGWKIRHLVVDTGKWLSGRRVLISPQAAGRPDPDEKAIPVSLSVDEVRSSPDIDTDRPISRQEEERLYGHYGWTPYWPVSGSRGGGVAGTMPPTVVTSFAGDVGSAVAGPVDSPPTASPEEPHGDPHLRSAREVEGYHIAAEDGEVGHVESFLIDLSGDKGTSRSAGEWAIRYLVVDTRDWMPGRTVLVAPDWIRRIDWARRQVMVDVNRYKVRHSPSYEALQGIERGYEDRLYGHYGRMPYW